MGSASVLRQLTGLADLGIKVRLTFTALVRLFGRPHPFCRIPRASIHFSPGDMYTRLEQPTFVKSFDATPRLHASVPAVTFGQLTHTSSSSTVWDVRGTICLHARGRPELWKSDDAEPV